MPIRLTLPLWEASQSNNFQHFFVEPMMMNFEVQDMSCGHCVGAITRAVKAVDPDAVVAVDLSAKRVQVDTLITDAQAVKSAIAEAGFTPVEFNVSPHGNSQLSATGQS